VTQHCKLSSLLTRAAKITFDALVWQDAADRLRLENGLYARKFASFFLAQSS